MSKIAGDALRVNVVRFRIETTKIPEADGRPARICDRSYIHAGTRTYWTHYHLGSGNPLFFPVTIYGTRVSCPTDCAFGPIAVRQAASVRNVQVCMP